MLIGATHLLLSTLLKLPRSEFRLDPTGAEPIPDAPLLYVYPGNAFPADAPNGETIFNGSAVGNNATIRFEKGKTYRLRFINTSGETLPFSRLFDACLTVLCIVLIGLAMFYVGLDGHDISVIELDGVRRPPTL